jgi:putative PIN family toxin of toxin-antitoxin system
MAADDRPRAFLDTNVIVSALYSADGPPAEILRRHIEGRITAVVSQQVVDELIRAVSRKLPEALPHLRDLLLNAPPEIVPDPSADEVERLASGVNHLDAPLLAAAVVAGVDYLVSGDTTFLREARRLKPAPVVVTPRELLQRL